MGPSKAITVQKSEFFNKQYYDKVLFYMQCGKGGIFSKLKSE